MPGLLGRSKRMRIVVDLTRCQSYGQCVFAAPTVFRFHGAEALEYDYAPTDTLAPQVRWAAAACPVHAISLDAMDDRAAGTDDHGASAPQSQVHGGRA
jgi:ferredoxin